MQLKTAGFLLVLFGYLAGMVPALAQSGQTSTKPKDGTPKPPDLVCFGNGPSWSIQFTNTGARYIGMNEPDRTYIGRFVWDANVKAWAWSPTDLGQNPPLTATIQKASCVDNVRNWTVPYKAQVNLPSGDMVSGCCRKLKPGEAPVGPGGYSPAPKQQ